VKTTSKESIAWGIGSREDFGQPSAGSSNGEIVKVFYTSDVFGRSDLQTRLAVALFLQSQSEFPVLCFFSD